MKLALHLALPLALLLCAPGTAFAQDAGALYRQGVEARNEGNLSEAVGLLERAAALQPGNADIFVQLGFARLGLDRREAAARAFRRALDLAPDYADARYGLALVAYREGRLDRAEDLARDVVEAEPEYDGAVRLLDDIRAARRSSGSPATAGMPWRLDISGELSDLGAGRGDWTDSRLVLSRRFGDRTTVAGSFRLAKRYGMTDTQPGLRIDRMIDERLGIYGEIAGTPDAEFLAEVSLGAGAHWRATPEDAGPFPVFLGLDVDQDFYPATEITTVFPGLRIGAYGDRFAVGLRGVASFDDTGAEAYGYVVRLDLRPHPDIGLLAGYGDAPEISEGELVDTETLFAGISVDITERLTLRASYAHERRDAFDRDTFGLAFSHRF